MKYNYCNLAIKTHAVLEFEQIPRFTGNAIIFQIKLSNLFCQYSILFCHTNYVVLILLSVYNKMTGSLTEGQGSFYSVGPCLRNRCLESKMNNYNILSSFY